MDLTGARWRKSSRSGSNGGHCVEVAPVWRKSSRSGVNGGTCVEIAPAWRKSSRSSGNGGDCVEVAPSGRAVAVRDSKDPAGPKLAVPERDWAAFTAALKDGRLTG